jgi:hypothetical protein
LYFTRDLLQAKSSQWKLKETRKEGWQFSVNKKSGNLFANKGVQRIIESHMEQERRAKYK